VKPFDRVLLRAEQDSRSFEWLLTRSFAEALADGLREKGWTVTIRHEDGGPVDDAPKD
jgi:hypothetical protein